MGASMDAFGIRGVELPTVSNLRDYFVLNSKVCGISAAAQFAKNSSPPLNLSVDRRRTVVNLLVTCQ